MKTPRAQTYFRNLFVLLIFLIGFMAALWQTPEQNPVMAQSEVETDTPTAVPSETQTPESEKTEEAATEETTESEEATAPTEEGTPTPISTELPLAVPKDILAQMLSQTEIMLTWTLETELPLFVIIESKYIGTEEWAEIGIVEPEVTSFLDDTLICGSLVEYRLRSYDPNTELFSEYSLFVKSQTLTCPTEEPVVEVPLEYQSLYEKAEENGSINIIIRLNTSYTPFGVLEHNQSALEKQQAGIKQAQETILNSIQVKNQNSVTKFELFPLLSMQVDKDTLLELLSSPEVLSIQEDTLVPPSLSVSVPIIGADTAWSNGYTGAGWTIAILDTGVDKNHPFLTGKVVSEACYSMTYSGDGGTTLCSNGLNTQTGEGSGLNCSITGCDHGTHVAGIAAGNNGSLFGVAPDADLISIQVFTRFDGTICTENGYSSPCVLSYNTSQILALERILFLHQNTTLKISSVNMSLGGGSYTSYCAGDSREDALDDLYSVGIATIIASGNSYYSNAVGAPGCIENAVTIGSTTNNPSNEQVSSFSNSNYMVDLLAPGESIYSSIPGTSYTYKGGTSMATPHVAGAWAVLKQAAPDASVSDILGALISTGTMITDIKNGVTKPRINVDLALEELIPDIPTNVQATDGVHSDRIVITWNAVSGTAYYEVYRASQPLGAQTLVGSPTSNSFEDNTAGNGNYLYWVKSCRSYMCSGKSDWDSGYKADTLNQILVVDDDNNSPDTFSYFTDTLSSLSLTYDLWDTGNSDEEPLASVLAGYEIVIWNSGDNQSTGTGPSSNSELALSNWLDTGTCLLVSGQDYHEVRGKTGFMSNYLGVDNIINNVGQNTAQGTGSYFSAIPQYVLSYPADFSNTKADQITALSGAEVSFLGSIGNAGISKWSGDYFTTFLVFPFEALPSLEARQNVMNSFLAGCPLAAPSDLSGTGTSTSTIDLSWIDNSFGETAFHIERMQNGESEWTEINTTAADAETWQDTELMCGMTYQYRIRGFHTTNNAYSEYSNTTSATTDACTDTWYLAEGYSGGGFQTYILIQNPGDTLANVDVTYMVEGGEIINKKLTVDPYSRFTIVAHDAEQVGVDKAFSTRIGSDQNIFVERAMYWPNGDGLYGGHVTIAVDEPATEWYLAEGFTGGGFNTYILLQNPSNSVATVDITYLIQGVGTETGQFTIQPNSRQTVWVNNDPLVGADKAFSTNISSDQPIIVERAMYFVNDGHASIGINSPNTEWYLAEGYTGGPGEGIYTDTFILLQNPNPSDANVTLLYLLANGSTIEKSVTVSGNSRYTVATHDESQIGRDQTFSTKITSDQPIIVERAMYWPKADGWGGHNNPAVSLPKQAWNLAEGFTGGGFMTYILIQNPNDTESVIDITYMIQGGGTHTDTITVPANSRYTIVVNSIPELVDQAFSTRLVAQNPALPIIVERAMYFSNGGHNTSGLIDP